LKLKVTIPANTTATVAMPAADASSVFESGRAAEKVRGIKFVRMDAGAALFEAGSGTYEFETK
jgi:alpha-L-rhamnosidase